MSDPFGVVHVRLARGRASLKDAADGGGGNIHEELRLSIYAPLTRE